MISVQNLTKRFGATLAVDGISFEIPQGQVVGFLGPNGAGKSTTMRLLTGYLQPDDGSAQLMGHNLTEDSLAIRRQLGYIPENNPLPEDLETTDYLHFIGKLRGLQDDAARKESVARVIKLCSLKSAVGKRLGELSKGYRQRVGLAQAIIHDPEVLILDEPTSGLDPNQVEEVRQLIKSLRGQKTLLISTHILTEVQQTCDRILIINKGKIVGDGSPQSLTGSMQNMTRLFVSFRGPMDSIEAKLRELGGVRSVTRHPVFEGETGFIVESEAQADLREDVFRMAVQNNWPMMGLRHEKLSLEDVFRALTKDERGVSRSDNAAS